ncbi:MAG: 6-bladed beta-propeller [Deltaproteobacteria bacterium]|nr:6-bladed beta-propeller [Deltaproteobacteria bacterium]
MAWKRSAGGQHRRLPALVATWLLAAAVAACSSGWPAPSRPAESARLVWPEPPDTPRIEFVSAFRAGRDLGIQPSVWSRLAAVVSGGGETPMVRPTGVSAANGRIAVADPGAGLVHLYDPARRRALQLRSCGEAALAEPVGVVLLGERVYVADASAARIAVFDLDGDCVAAWPLESGSRPAGLAADPARSRIYVAEAGTHRVIGFDPQGNRVLELGRRGAGAAEFNYPTWLAVDGAGNIYVTDALNFRVQIFDPQGRSTGVFGEQGDGSGALSRPKGIGVDRAGHIYLVDALFDAVQIFDREGHYLMVFGGGGREPGHLWLPSGLAIDGDRIYVADSYNQRVQVFRFLAGES